MGWTLRDIASHSQGMAHLRYTQILDCEAQKAFDFLNNPQSVGYMLTPLITVKTASVEHQFHPDKEYEFLMTRFGITQLVKVYIEDVLPGRRMTFRQTLGIFKSYRQTTICEPIDDHRVQLSEEIDFEMHFGVFGAVFSTIFVKRDLKLLLKHRFTQIERRLKK